MRLLDCINKPADIINRTLNELKLKGFVLTDHECLSGHVKFNKMQQEIQKEHPDFKIGLGNEIYLIDKRSSETGLKPKYYHYILIAKDLIGHKQLRELSSEAWLNSSNDGMERVPTTKEELKKKIKENPGHLIASTACLGGQLSSLMLELELETEEEKKKQIMKEISEFINFNLDLFGDDFYLECAPGSSKEQILVNKRLLSFAKNNNFKLVIGTDSHYLRKEDRLIHKVYLTSGGKKEREVDSFYEYSYLQDENEIIENLSNSGYTIEDYEWLCANSMDIYNKIENYSLFHTQQIPTVPVTYYDKQENVLDEKYKTLNYLTNSEEPEDRQWIFECLEALKAKELYNDTYLSRLEEEAEVKKFIGDKLSTNIFRYPLLLKHYIDLFWECGSSVAPGRGSSGAGLNHYLLQITQADPIKWNLPFFRYLNKERVELPDVDTDVCPSKRPLILKRIKEERKKNFKKDLSKKSVENLGCTLIATFKTETSKSAVLTSCRGYVSEEFPNGIDSDVGLYLTGMIPEERGFVWSLSEVFYGNKEKDRKPVSNFIKEVEKYPGLKEIMLGIEGLYSSRSSHASGVIMFDKDPYDYCCFMKTPKGEIITQYDLGDAEYVGLTKIDLLVTQIQDIITQTITLLQKDNLIDPKLSLREAYNKYLHPENVNLNDPEIIKAIQEVKPLALFQLDSPIGRQGTKIVKPENIQEISDVNGLIRLMTSEKGEETPLQKYVRFKQNKNAWIAEMNNFNLTAEEQELFKKYWEVSNGMCISQETIMRTLMDENLCNFTLKEANYARKTIAKKKMNEIPVLKEQILSSAKTPQIGEYIWKCGIGPQLGYSFSIIHSLLYTMITYQTAILSTKFPEIYWNTAYLIVKSGGLEDESAESNSDFEEETTATKKTITTDYSKVAIAIEECRQHGIKVDLLDINNSETQFKPSLEDNSILFGLKGVANVGDDVVKQIIENRPYSSFENFLSKTKIKKTSVINLIKGGAFDKIEKNKTRVEIMYDYIHLIAGEKSRLTLQNFNGLINKNLVDEKLNFEVRVYRYTKILNKVFKTDNDCYDMNNETILNFYLDNFDKNDLMIENDKYYLPIKIWDKKYYQPYMDNVRTWIKESTNLLKEYNKVLFNEEFEKDCETTNLSKWEMDSVSYYFHEHELAQVRKSLYGIKDYKTLPKQPEIEDYFHIKGKDIPKFKITKIIGTVIGKNKAKSSIYLLTPDGVVLVRFRQEYFAMFDKQISEKQPDGTKKIMEKSWFTRGNKLMITGFRRDDQFVPKKYKSTGGHTLYKILGIKEGGELIFQDERYSVEEDIV